MSRFAVVVARSGQALVWSFVALALIAGMPARLVAQDPLDDLLNRQVAIGPNDAQVAVTAQFTAPKEGEPARLFIVCKIDPGWHIYSLTQAKEGPLASKITLAPSEEFKLKGAFTPSPVPHKGTEPEAFGEVVIESHEKQVVWYAPIELAAGVDAAKLKIKGKVTVQACNATGCVPPTSYDFVAELGSGVKIEAPPKPEKPAAPQATNAYKADGKHTTLSGYLEPATAAPGEKLTLALTAAPDPDWHVYAYAQQEPAKPGSKPVLITVEAPAGWQVGTPQTTSQTDGDSMGVPYHSSAVTWTIELTPPAGAPLGETPITGLIGYQSCNDKAGCDIPAAARFDVAATIGPVAKTGVDELAFSAAKYSEVAAAAKQAAPPVGAADFDPGKIRAPQAAGSIGWALAAAFVGGFLLNFMPCVLPVIGLKLFSFMQQAGESRWRIFSLNLWYTAGLMTVFMLLAWLAVAFGFGWGTGLNTNPVYMIALTAVVFAMALSFLGVWEIPIPGFAAGSTAQSMADREGPAGAYTKGIITTLLATPCTGPLMAPALAWAVQQPPTTIFSVFASLGLGMASPYLVIGAFPNLVHWLPKPGAWMETFKQLMGFVLLGTVVWLLNAIVPHYVVPTVGLLFGLWMALWWFGRTPLYAEFGERVKAWAGAIAIAGMAYVAAFSMAAGPSSDDLPWQQFTMAELRTLTAANKTVIVDFTADWCATCKVLEATVLNEPETKALVESYGIVPLVADMTHQTPGNKSDENTLLNAVAGTTQIPVLAIFPAGRPNDPIVFNGPYTMSSLLEALRKAGPSQGAPGAGTTIAEARAPRLE